MSFVPWGRGVGKDGCCFKQECVHFEAGGRKGAHPKKTAFSSFKMHQGGKVREVHLRKTQPPGTVGQKWWIQSAERWQSSPDGPQAEHNLPWTRVVYQETAFIAQTEATSVWAEVSRGFLCCRLLEKRGFCWTNVGLLIKDFKDTKSDCIGKTTTWDDFQPLQTALTTKRNNKRSLVRSVHLFCKQKPFIFCIIISFFTIKKAKTSKNYQCLWSLWWSQTLMLTQRLLTVWSHSEAPKLLRCSFWLTFWQLRSLRGTRLILHRTLQ